MSFIIHGNGNGFNEMLQCSLSFLLKTTALTFLQSKSSLHPFLLPLLPLPPLCFGSLLVARHLPSYLLHLPSSLLHLPSSLLHLPSSLLHLPAVLYLHFPPHLHQGQSS